MPGPSRPGGGRDPRALGRKAVGVGACHIRPESRSPRAPSPPAAQPLPAAFPVSSAPRCFLTRQPPGPQEARGTPRKPQRREPATSPQDGGRHHRDSPRRAPSSTRKNPEDGAGPGRSEQARGAAAQCAGVNRNSARELEAGRWVLLERRRLSGRVRRRTSRAAALGEAWSDPPASSRSAYVLAPPSGASCAIRSPGTATW